MRTTILAPLSCIAHKKSSFSRFFSSTKDGKMKNKQKIWNMGAEWVFCLRIFAVSSANSRVQNQQILPKTKQKKRIEQSFLTLEITNSNNCTFIEHLSWFVARELEFLSFFRSRGFKYFLFAFSKWIHQNTSDKNLDGKNFLMKSGNVAKKSWNEILIRSPLIALCNYSRLNDAFELDIARCI